MALGKLDHAVGVESDLAKRIVQIQMEPRFRPSRRHGHGVNDAFGPVFELDASGFHFLF